MTANDNKPGLKRPSYSTQRANVAALIAIAIVAAALFWVVSAIRQHDAVQDCIDSGRHDCVEPGTGDH